MQYAGNTLSHLEILENALHTLLWLQSCSPTYGADIHSYLKTFSNSTFNPPIGEIRRPPGVQ